MLDAFCYRTHNTLNLNLKCFFFFCCINQWYPKWGRPPVGSTESLQGSCKISYLLHFYYLCPGGEKKSSTLMKSF